MSFTAYLSDLGLDQADFTVFVYEGVLYKSYELKEIHKKYFFEIRVSLCFIDEKIEFIKLQEEKFLALVKTDWKIEDRKERIKLDSKTVLIDLMKWAEYKTDDVSIRVKQAVREFCGDLARITREVQYKTSAKKEQTFGPYRSSDFGGVFSEINEEVLKKRTHLDPNVNFHGFVIVKWIKPGNEVYEVHSKVGGMYLVENSNGIDLNSERNLVEGFFKKLYPEARSGFSSISASYRINN